MLHYLYQVTTVTKMPIYFQDALAWALAAELALPLAVRPDLDAYVRGRAQQAIATAQAMAFRGVQADVLPDGEFVSARF